MLWHTDFVVLTHLVKGVIGDGKEKDENTNNADDSVYGFVVIVTIALFVAIEKLILNYVCSVCNDRAVIEGDLKFEILFRE
jgi:hypothetical protein